MIKYIFCISPGCSGTAYLSKIFENCYNTISLHEPSPICNDEPMHEFLKGNSNSMDIVAEEKYKDILSKQTNKKIYIETNHCFIKSFGWYLSNYLNCDEIYLMGNRFENQHKDISFYAVDINDINDIQKVYKMLDYFKITPCQSLKGIINKPVN